MEYYIFLTYSCNLNCSYCSSGRVLSSTKGTEISFENIKSVIEHIKRNNNGENHSVVFFGGEPLLRYDLIEFFVNETSTLNLTYTLYTNGLLLDVVPLNILESLDIIIISVDGDKESHEKHRGEGTYDKIISNVKILKPKLSSFFIGRITAEEETDIFKSVTNIVDNFDAIYWQIVNKPSFHKINNFINNYKNNTEKLFHYWLSNFKEGRIINIIPFQAVISTLLFNYKNNDLSFRCRSGSALQVIDPLDGNVYWCDEYIGDKKGIIGDINGNLPVMPYKRHDELFSDCKECDISAICLGRCRKCLEEYSTDTVRNYCILTKLLVKIIKDNINDIKYIINNGNHNLKTFYNGPYCTEEIP